MTWGVPGSPTPLSQDLTGQHPTQKVQGQNLAKETYSFLQENGKGNQTRNLNRKPGCPLPAQAPFKCLQVRASSWSFSLVRAAIMLIRGQSEPRGVPATSCNSCWNFPKGSSLMAPTFYHYSPVPMVDNLEEFIILTRRKLPLWLGLLLLAGAAGLLAPLVYFAVRANSEACLDGLRAQTECQGLNQHLQRQLHQAQEVFHEKVAEAATCNRTVVSHCTSSRGPRTWRSLPGSLWRWRQTLKLCPFVTTRVWEPPNSLWGAGVCRGEP